MILILPLRALALGAIFIAPTLPHTPPGDPAGAEAAASVVRTYDLGALRSRGIAEASLGILPYLTPRWDEGVESDELGFSSVFVTQLILTAFPEQFDYADRALWAPSENELMVRAPEALQEEITALLGELASAVDEHAVLRVDFLTLPTAQLPASLPQGVVASAAAHELRSLSGAEIARSTHHLAAFTGRTARAELTREYQLVLGYGLQVATGVFVHDPQVHIVPVGTKAYLRAAPGRNGLELAYVIQRAQPLGGPRTESVRQRALLTGESFVQSQATSQAWQSLRVVTRSIAGSAFLETGKALVFRSDLDLHGVANSEFMILEQVGGGLSSHRAPSSDAARGLQLVNAEALSPPRFEFSGELREVAHGHERSLGSVEMWDSSIWLGAYLHSIDIDYALQVLRSSSTGLSLESSRPWIVGLPDPDALRELESSGTGVVRIADALAVLATEPQMVELTLSLRTGGADGARVGHCVLPLRIDRDCMLAFGREALAASQAEAQVAANAAGLRLVATLAFEGLALRARPHRRAGGEFVLELTGEARVLIGSNRFDLESPVVESLQQSHHDRLAFDERLVIRPGDAPRLLSESSGAQTGAALTLEVSLR